DLVTCQFDWIGYSMSTRKTRDRAKWMIGGHPGADFLNTIDARGRANEREHLGDYASLLRWMSRANLMSASEVTALRRAAKRHARLAKTALSAARELREAGHALVASHLGPAARAPGSAHTIVADAIVSAGEARRMVWSKRGLEWRWRDSDALLH